MKKCLLLIIPFFVSGCSISQKNIDRTYLNYRYELTTVGDIHGLNPTSNEVLNRNPGFTSYNNLFDFKNSYIDFQCEGSNFDNFRCFTKFCVIDANGVILAGGNDYVFETSYSGGQSGTVNIFDESIKEEIGTIYVYTPYWCRWQQKYDVDNDGKKELLTFEFWKRQYNEVPVWGGK